MKIFIIFLIALVFNCKSNHAFIYQPTNIVSKQSLNKILVILPFKDLRGNENFNYQLLILFPLIPYGQKILDQPENDISPYLFRPKSDLPNAFVTEFESKKLFKEIYIPERPQKFDADYIIEGELIKSKIDSKSTTYLLGALGVYLRLLFGLPVEYSNIEVSLKLKFSDKSGKLLLEEVYYKEHFKLIGLYYNMFSRNEGLNIIFNEIVKDFSKKVEDKILSN